MAMDGDDCSPVRVGRGEAEHPGPEPLLKSIMFAAVTAAFVLVASLVVLAVLTTKWPGLKEIAGPAATVATLIGLAVGAAIAGRRQLTSERTYQVARDKQDLDRERHDLDIVSALRDRYTTIASQLGSDSAAVRLAGVYATAALADEWLARPDPRAMAEAQTCIDLLCAYIRTPRAYATELDRAADLE